MRPSPPCRGWPIWSARSTHRPLRPGLLQHHPRRHSARHARQGHSRCPLDRSLQLGLRVIGLIYLVIGFYVLFRRWGAPRATHFYLFCLVSFALYALKYTGAVRRPGLDCLLGQRRRRIAAAGALPAFRAQLSRGALQESSPPLAAAAGLRARRGLCLASGSGPSPRARPPSCCSTSSTRSPPPTTPCSTSWPRCSSCAATAAPTTPLLRQQLKWVTRGTLLAVLPFTLFYADSLPASTCNPPSLLTNLAGLSLVFLPLTFSWAIVRYRLMDTDLIFKRGVAYTLATGLLLGGYFGIIALISVLVHNAMPEAVREWGLVHRHSGHRRHLRSAQAPHSGLGRPRLRPPSLRLPQGAGRVRPRPEFGNRSCRRCSSPSSSSCRARCWWRALPSSLRRVTPDAAAPGRSHGLPEELDKDRREARSTARSRLPRLRSRAAITRTSFLRTRSRRCICPRTSSAPRPCST